MERSAADDDAGIRGMSDVSTALADAPSTSGAHWANRDNENIYRRTGTPFRRPNAVNSFPDDGDEGDEPSEQDEDPTSWWGSPEAVGQHSREPGEPGRSSWPEQAATDQSSWPQLSEPADQQQPRREFAPTPEYGPAPPLNGSRASFGVTAGPIGGYRPGYGPTSAPTSPAARPTSPAGAPVSPAPRSKPLVPPVTGHTGEIFNGPAREIRAHRAMRQNTGGQAALKSPTPPRGTPVQAAAGPKRSRGVTFAALALGAVVLIGSAVGGVVYFSGDNNKGLGSVLELGAGKTDGRTATAPLDGRKTASFEMVAASSQVTVKSQDLGDDLYKITTADDSGMVPSPAVSADRVQLHLTPKGTGTSGDVTIVLSTKVRWSLRFSGGSDEQLIDMTGGKVSGVNLIGGARRVELTLPKPTGTVPVQVTGALEELSVTSPPDAPVRVNVEAGAKTIAAGTRTLRDVKPGSTVTPKDWQAANRYDVEAKSWVTLLSVDAKA